MVILGAKMKMETRLIVFTTALLASIERTAAHGRLIEPPSRASAWRYGFDTPHNYNDHELYCGGFTRQWVKNGGKCGVCGDAWDTKKPRPHEYGGTYGQGVIVRKYGVGSTINVRVELTANHNGYFEFAICPDFKSTTQKCLDANVLRLVRPQDGVPHGGTKYFPKEGNKVYEMKYRLPKKTCKHCVLQWRYIAGNNWGNCPNGTGAVGCGPQEEFRACSDITISGKATDEPMLPPTDIPNEIDDNEDYNELLPPSTVPTTTLSPTYDEESYSPISGFVIALISFLVACLALFLLYFHFYRVGDQIKNWIKGKTDKTDKSAGGVKVTGVNIPPTVPPRARKGGKEAEGGIQDASLGSDKFGRIV